MEQPHIAFAKNLRRFRKEAELSRAALAQRLGYTDKAIEKWESGTALPPLPTLCTLAELLGISLDALVYPAEPTIRYYLGIDGGGTKTAFRLEDAAGALVAQHTLGPSNPNDIGISASLSVLTAGLNEVCRGIDKRQISLFAGIAGGMSRSNADAFHEFFAGLGLGRFGHGSDLENARELALRGGDGVAAILGTGSIAYAQKSGVCRRIGGWGYLLDNAGSGYDLGRDALNAALCAIDGTGKPTVLAELLAGHLGKSIPDAIPEIYAGGKRLIAGCAPVLFAACDLGDAAALEILDRSMRRIAQILQVGAEYVGHPDAPLVLLGGLCARSDLLEPCLRKHLHLPNPVVFSTEQMVNGAVLLARKENLPC